MVVHTQEEAYVREGVFCLNVCGMCERVGMDAHKCASKASRHYREHWRAFAATVELISTFNKMG